jgi:RHS repeat-associated protein
MRVAMIVGGGQLVFVHNDHLGTPQVITDAAQQVVWQGDYLPFGEVTPVVSSIDNPIRFPGQYYDDETGMHYNYFRDYDPGIGRYVQSDPVGLLGGLNTYTYALADPVQNTDPLGLWVPQAAGALINLGFEGYRQYRAGEFDGGKLAVAAATGALGGFGSSVLKSFTYGAAAGALNTAYQEIDSADCNRDIDLARIIRSAGLGGLGGLTGFGGASTGRNIYRPTNIIGSDVAKRVSSNYGQHGAAVGAAGGSALGNQ